MKKIVYGLLATLSGLVLLFSYRTSLGESVPVATALAETRDASSPSTAAPRATATDTGSASTGSASTGSGSTDSGSTDGTFTGDAANTRYGAVQVQITVSGGEITAVEVPAYPDSNGRDRQINERALPQLVSETIDAQSADIHMVSGATYTSEGYLQSLQSAIDKAAR